MRLRRPAATATLTVLVLLTAGCGVATALTTAAPAESTHLRGTVTAENGPSWTVATPAKRTITVTLTPRTTFGTTKAPASVAQFPVGSRVRVSGEKQGDAVSASRITAAAAGA